MSKGLYIGSVSDLVGTGPSCIGPARSESAKSYLESGKSDGN